MALCFTSEGAVGVPSSLQIRVAPGRPGRIRVGAPAPSRSMTKDEVLANARHFRSPGPRSAPIDRVVLSALPDDWLGSTVQHMVAALGDLGIEGVVIHLDEIQARALSGPFAGAELVVATRAPIDLQGVAVPLALTVPLERSVLDGIADVMAAVEALGPSRVTFVWPFPDGTSARPQGADAVARILAAHLGRWRDAPFPWGIKGLPRCVLAPLEAGGSLAGRIWRTRNRYYVDAEHQGSDALMFEPDLIQVVKSDRCRFCAVDDRCDGVASRWLAEGLVVALIPLEAP